MYLYIDPSVQNTIRLVLCFPGQEKEYVVEGKNRELLQVIEEVFARERLDYSSLEGIVILVGVGGFSSTRIASVVGNAFAYALKLPIVGVRENSTPTFENVRHLCSSSEVGVYLSPAYSGEPNIGKSS